MQLYPPLLTLQDAYLEFARDWHANGEEITPYSARLFGHTYAEWLADARQREVCAIGGFVPAHTFFWVDGQGAILGAINLRHTLNAYLLQCGGHIGYGIRPSARGHGQAAAMLAATLPHARALGLTRVLLTCDRGNLASARTIQNCGGVLENEVSAEGRTVQRYWIAL